MTPRKRQRRPNPELALVLANPGEIETEGAELVSRRVTWLEYEHLEDGKGVVRFHPFQRGVEMWALPNGSVLLTQANGKPLWERF